MGGKTPRLKEKSVVNKWNQGNTGDGLKAIQDRDYEYRANWYRPPAYKWDIPYEEWKDSASCAGHPSELFELQDFDRIPRDDQHESIAQGLKICVACPVRQACKSNSNEHDRYWTIRGGQPPEGLFEDSKMPRYDLGQQVRGGFAPGKGPKRELKKACKRGHENWRVKKDGRRFCESCRQLQESKRWKESKYRGTV